MKTVTVGMNVNNVGMVSTGYKKVLTLVYVKHVQKAFLIVKAAKTMVSVSNATILGFLQLID